MISLQSKLADLLLVLQKSAWIGLDTEADSLHAYPEKLCLLQLSCDGDVVLVDPLAAMDLAPLFEALGGRELIMHGADYDLRLLRRGFQFVPATVFDTMLAARLLGIRQFGLANLVAQHLGVTLEKGPQKANWAQRPLTERMEAYAQNDVRFLKPLADLFRAELQQKGRLAWLQESSARLVIDCAQLRPRDPDLVWRLSGSDRLDRPALAVLRELWHWREEEAIRRNRPPYFVLSHETLVALAVAAAGGQTLDPWLPRRFSPEARHRVIATIDRALDRAVTEQPHPLRRTRHHTTAAQEERFETLKRKRDEHARALDIDPTLIASRATLKLLAQDWEAHQHELMDWQRPLVI
ncbi:MAG: ribonuclease D [Limisphaerales bacterium]